jgi:hypothetical protein
MDKKSYDILSVLDLDALKLISLQAFEEGDEELLKAKQNRSRIEYYFTCTPSLQLFILNNFSEVDAVIYLDADLCFFADPSPIFEEIGNSSVAIIEHRFPPHLKDRALYGIYNVGWLYFKRDENGISCLKWWRTQCNKWCYDWIEDGKFADQKYLDNWPNLFNNVMVVQHKGANLAPWNIENYNIDSRNGNIEVDDQPLIFYHFHGIKHILGKLYDSGLSDYRVRLSRMLLNNIYLPYLYDILAFEKGIRKVQSPESAGYLPRGSELNNISEFNSKWFNNLRRMSPHLFAVLNKLSYLIKILFSGTYIVLHNSPVKSLKKKCGNNFTEIRKY